MKNLWVALGIVGAIIVVVLILNTGGPTTDGPEDPGSDVAVDEGDAPPEDAGLADIRRAEVRRDGSDLVFEVRLSQELPKRIPKGSLEFRWDISENGDETWIVSANISSLLTAALTSQHTSYGSSTIDDTMPGTVAVDGDTLTVTFTPTDVKTFPNAFNWILTTTLDADLVDPTSAVATDTAPDSGPGSVE